MGPDGGLVVLAGAAGAVFSRLAAHRPWWSGGCWRPAVGGSRSVDPAVFVDLLVLAVAGQSVRSVVGDIWRLFFCYAFFLFFLFSCEKQGNGLIGLSATAKESQFHPSLV